MMDKTTYEKSIPLSPQRESGITRIVGVSKETEASVLAFFKHVFEESRLSFKERPQTPETVALIEEVNLRLQKFLSDLGFESVPVLPKHFHFFEVDQFDAHLQEVFKGKAAMYLPSHQAVVFLTKEAQQKSRLELAITIAHELLHFNSFCAYALKENSRERVFWGDMVLTQTVEKEQHYAVLRLRRAGLSLYVHRSAIAYFSDWDEAVITELSKRFDRRYFSQIPALQTEKKGLAELLQDIESIKDAGNMTPADFINDASYFEDRKALDQEEHFEAKVHSFPYVSQRAELNALIDDLYQKNHDRFTDREDVFILFARATIQGDLKPLVSLIEKTYGRGSFKRLAQEEWRFTRVPLVQGAPL